MTIPEILQKTNHRPWPLPAKKWNYYQEWRDVVFLHWKVDLGMLQQFVPKELTIDTFEGSAYVSLVPFTMEKIRPRFLPPFSPISTFHEVNVRTYVSQGSKTGVYFLSIEASKRLSCFLARSLSGLPYRPSSMNRSQNHYSAKNYEFADQLELQYEIGSIIQNKSPLDIWLTERYALYHVQNHEVFEFEVHHAEWQMQEAKVKMATLHYERFAQLFSGTPDLCHYSKGVEVLSWDKVKKK